MALRPKPITSPMGRAFEGAFEGAISLVLGVVLGYYADRWLGTEPVALFVGLIVGFVAGFRRLLRIKWPEPPDQSESPGRGPSRDRGEGSDDSLP